MPSITQAFSNDRLDALRSIGDPRLETRLRRPGTKFLEYVDKHGVRLEDPPKKVAAHAAAWEVAVADAGKWLDGVGAAKDSLDKIRRARDVFARYGDEIVSALLLAALPEAYATAWGSQVLVAQGGLVWDVRRRIRQTALFVFDVLTPALADASADDARDALEDGTRHLALSSAGLRLLHHSIRTRLKNRAGPANKMPINQEDLLGTLLTFTVTTFRVLDEFGIDLTSEEKESYLFLWDLVGAFLGIGVPEVLTTSNAAPGTTPRSPKWLVRPSGWASLRPKTVEDATALLDILQKRQWEPVQEAIGDMRAEKKTVADRRFTWSPFVSGRLLVRALLDELETAMPPRRRRWPLVVMRELACQPVVNSRLGLSNSGLLAYLAEVAQGFPPDALRTSVRQRARGRILHMMAAEVSRRATVQFVRADGPPLRMGGIDLRDLQPRPLSMSIAAASPPRRTKVIRPAKK
jgi:hypothetical protein